MDAKIINLEGKEVKIPNPPQNWVIVVVGAADQPDQEYHVEGYFKFGTQFVAVLDGEDDNSNLLFSSPAVYLRAAYVEDKIDVTLE